MVITFCINDKVEVGKFVAVPFPYFQYQTMYMFIPPIHVDFPFSVFKSGSWCIFCLMDSKTVTLPRPFHLFSTGFSHIFFYSVGLVVHLSPHAVCMCVTKYTKTSISFSLSLLGCVYSLYTINGCVHKICILRYPMFSWFVFYIRLLFSSR